MTPTVFLPGLLCDATLWRPVIDGLSDLVAPMVADLTLDDSMKAMAARTLEAAPERFNLVGLSMGGYVAFEIIRQAPERVERIALMATSALSDSPEASANRRAGMKQIGEGRFIGVAGGLLPKLVHPDHIDGPIGATVQAMSERVGQEAYLRQQEAIIGRSDSRATLHTITCPTVMIVGEEDVLTPVEQAQIIHQGIKGSRLYELNECGHLPPLEQPEAVTAILKDWMTA